MTPRNAPTAGFSLTELVGSIGVLVLVALALPGRRERAPSVDRERVGAHFEQLVAALDAHVVDTGRWPFDVSLEQAVDPASIAGLFRDDGSLRGWSGPYLDAAHGADATDPWGRAYRLHSFAQGERGIALVLWSGGPNGSVETDVRALRGGRARGDDLVLRVIRTR